MFLKDGFSLTKKIGRLSEDAVFFSNNLVAIIDGASSKTTRLFEGKTPGRVVMELIVERLKIISAKKPNITVIELFNDLNDTILNWHKVGGTFEEAKINPNIRPSATFTCYLPNIGEYGTVASIAEHNFMIDEVLYERSFEIDRMYEKIKKIVTPKLQEVYKNDISKIANILNEVLVPLYNTQPNFQNSDDNLKKTILKNVENKLYSLHFLQYPKISIECPVILNPVFFNIDCSRFLIGQFFILVNLPHFLHIK